MRTGSRLFVLAVAVATALPMLATPAAGSTEVGLSASATAPCVLSSIAASGLRAVLTPGERLVEDVAFNVADRDAPKNPLVLIRFPDESGLWQDAGVVSSKMLAAGADLLIVSARVLPFGGAERWDTEISDSVVRLYCGLFDRRPDPYELEYWVGRYRNGLPLVTMAEAFTHGAEFASRYGSSSAEGLVSLLYRNVLGRQADAATVTLRAEPLRSGVEHAGQVIVRFTESAEYTVMTRTASPVKPVLPYPDVGSGRRIIYTNAGQRVWLVNETGELFKTHQVTGRRGIPAVGRYRVYSMSRYAWAPYDGITMEYMVRFARGEWPYGFHSIPVYPDKQPLQVPAKLGTHGSGGCVRQLWGDAETVFDWATIGTRVIVTP